jgi:hypothetical protein
MKFLTLLLTTLALSACGKSQTPSDPLHEAALRTCKDTIEARAINRKTVNYLQVEVAPAGKGQLAARINFSAKNEIGMAYTMQARCVTSADGKTLAEITVKTL